MRSLIVIWVLAGLTVLGGTMFINSEVNKLVQREVTIESKPVVINYCDTSGLVPVSHFKGCLSGFNSLEVQNSDSSLFLQPAGLKYEDEMREVEAIQPTIGTNELQHMKHYWYIQPTEWRFGVTYDPQLAEDVTMFNSVKYDEVRL
jgi:hypothetical protein